MATRREILQAEALQNLLSDCKSMPQSFDADLKIIDIEMSNSLCKGGLVQSIISVDSALFCLTHYHTMTHFDALTIHGCGNPLNHYRVSMISSLYITYFLF